jgi:TPP-dependent indolepyruvate ferredoxin oxidoreductase alpha subunit
MSLTHPSHVILVPGADGRVFSEDIVHVHASGIATHPITSSRFGGIPSMPPLVICRDCPSDPVHRATHQADNATGADLGCALCSEMCVRAGAYCCTA